MDASNLLKPALGRGDLHCVGATTLNEYRKVLCVSCFTPSAHCRFDSSLPFSFAFQYIEKDAALARRFQTVFVSEPSVEETISILRGCCVLLNSVGVFLWCSVPMIVLLGCA